MGPGCWEWQGGKGGTGYGTVKVEGRMVLAHRIAFELVNGPIPPGKNVCHHCDNPPCVRPDHLFTGSQSDNIKDAVRKGRVIRPPQDTITSNHPPETVARGERHGKSKLTAEKVREMRLLRAEGWTHRQLAVHFGISRGTVGFVLNGTTWQHIQ
jgi:predicted DNA-binding protein (UPF0251 family)